MAIHVLEWLAINWMIQNLYLVNWLLYNWLFGVPGHHSMDSSSHKGRMGDSQKYPQKCRFVPRFLKRPLGCRLWGVHCFEALFGV